MGIPSETETITRGLSLFVGSIATNRHTHEDDDYCAEVKELKEVWIKSNPKVTSFWLNNFSRWLEQKTLTDNMTPVTPLSVLLAIFHHPRPHPHSIGAAWICILLCIRQLILDVFVTSLFLKDKDLNTQQVHPIYIVFFVADQVWLWEHMFPWFIHWLFLIVCLVYVHQKITHADILYLVTQVQLVFKALRIFGIFAGGQSPCHRQLSIFDWHRDVVGWRQDLCGTHSLKMSQITDNNSFKRSS